MASRSFHDLFLRARDQFVRSGRWTYAAVLGLAVLHGVVLTPFVEGSRRESQTTSERKRLTGVESGLGELHAALQAIREEVSSALVPDLEALVEDLGHDLARLDATRRRHAADDEATDGEAADGIAEAPGDGGETGEPPEAAEERAGGPPPFQLDDPDHIADLRDAETRDDLLAALAPLAEELIARPRWFDLERSWQDRALPGLQTRLDAAAGAVPRLRGSFPEARAQWEALAGALTALSRAAGELRLEPPAAPFWWTLPASGDEVELGLTDEVADEIRRPRELRDLQAAADLVLERHTEVTSELRRVKRDLGDPPGAAFLRGLDLAAVAPTFPLFLGLVLGGAVLWRSGRLRELGLTTRLAIEHGSPKALERWLWSHLQWSSSAGRSAAGAWRASLLQTLLGYFLAMGWITLAAVQLRRLDALDRQRLMVFAVAGAAAVLVAVAHRLAVVRTALGPLDHEADEDVEIDDDFDLGIAVAGDTAAPGAAVDDAERIDAPLRR